MKVTAIEDKGAMYDHITLVRDCMKLESMQRKSHCLKVDDFVEVTVQLDEVHLSKIKPVSQLNAVPPRKI
jgi:hypothetical protein